MFPCSRPAFWILFASLAFLASRLFAAAPATVPSPSLSIATLPAPEQAIVVDLHRPWQDGRGFDKNTPQSVVYGVDETAAHPKFTVVDPQVRSLWLYRFVMPIDSKQYPIVTMKYRASNISKNLDYAIRLVRADSGGNDNAKVASSVRLPLGTGTDLICDGQEHEFTKDLRTLSVDTPITSFGVGVQTDQQPAWLELIDVRFSAAPDAPPASALKDDLPMTVHVVDADDQPIVGAKVIVDAERANFARSGQTKSDGSVSITPLINSQQDHMVRVEKPGFFTVDGPASNSESGQGIDIKTVPAVRFGGVAKGDDGKPVANAQVMIKIAPKLRATLKAKTVAANVVTNDKGEWSTLPMPADADSLTVTLTQPPPADQQQPIVTQLKAADYKQPQATEAAATVTSITATGDAIPLGTAPAFGQQAAPTTQVVIQGADGSNNASIKLVDAAGKPTALIPAVINVQAAPQPSLPPEQAIEMDLHRPWLDGSKWDDNKPPVAFGVDQTSPSPRFSVVDPHSMSLWVYKLALPVDVVKYPMISIRYRAQNTSKDAPYVLRLVFEQGNIRSRGNAWAGSDLVADGQEHELQLDWRTMKAGGNQLVTFGIAIKSDDKPATLDLMGVKFSADPATPNDKPKPDLPLHLRVVDADGNAIDKANVIVDAERSNFARSGQTDGSGNVAITPLINESGKHMVRIERDGYLTIESPQTNSESGQAVDLKMIPAVRYGGIAKDAQGKPAARARVNLAIKPDLLSKLPDRIETNVVTDDNGNWSTQPLPADASKLTIQLSMPGGDSNGGAVAAIDAQASQLSKAPIASNGSKPGQHAANPPKGAAAPATPPAPEVKSVTAIIDKIDESVTAVGLVGIDRDQIHVMQHLEAGKDLPTTMPMADVADIVFKKAGGYNVASAVSPPTSRPTDKLVACRILMNGEDRLNGDITAWTQKRVSVKSSVAANLMFDLSVNQVREIWCGSADQVKKAQGLNEKTATEDVLFAAKDADVIAVHGIATGIQGDDLHFLYNDQDRKIALNRVIGLVLAKPDEAAAGTDDSFYQSIQFVTDEQISGHVTAFDVKQVTLALRGGDKTVQLPLEQVAKITNRNGRVVYVSDMKPTKVEQTPFFDRLVPYRMDQALTGKPIVLLDGTYAKGISVHSRCVLTFNLDGKFDEFRTKAGFAIPEGKLGQAVIRVIGDGKALFENLDAKGDQSPQDVKVSVKGVHELTLEVDYGKNDDTADRVTWANARVIRASVAQ